VRYLLDVNILVALTVRENPLHEAAQQWFRSEPDRLWATCALTQGGFLRVASHYLPGSRLAIRELLARLEFDCRSGFHEYWPVDVDMLDLSDSQRSRLIGHNQVTDMQLVMLAHRHKGQLATFDSGLGQLAQATGYTNSVVVLPA
jgi:toxin-antitoxin system PIN domain toxin